jgi:zinc/manganese transport system substrate-binding protein
MSLKKMNAKAKALTAALVSVFALPAHTVADEPLPVVATFSILGDMVGQIGGDAVSVTTLVGADGDTHVYQPTPADAKAVKEAKLLFINGLQFEGWLDRLAEAAEFTGETVVATDGMDTIAYAEHGDDHDDEHQDDHKDDHDDEHKDGHDDEHHDEHKDEQDGEHEDHHAHDHGEFDPHGWQSLKNAIVYVDNVTSALARVLPQEAALFYNNRADYVAKIEALDSEIREMLSVLPQDARTVVTSHDAFQYFGRDYDLTFLAPQGLSTESEASAKDVAALIEQMRDDNISAVFVENITDTRLIKQIANETSAVVGGKLYPGSLSQNDGPAASYLEFMRHNATTIAAALSAK